MLTAAERGDLDVRARCLTAHRVHVARLAMGHDDDASEDAETGAYIDASDAMSARALSANVEAYLRAIANASTSGGGE